MGFLAFIAVFWLYTRRRDGAVLDKLSIGKKKALFVFFAVGAIACILAAIFFGLGNGFDGPNYQDSSEQYTWTPPNDYGVSNQ